MRRDEIVEVIEVKPVTIADGVLVLGVGLAVDRPDVAVLAAAEGDLVEPVGAASRQAHLRCRGEL